jgi:hypothetical protein
MSTLDPAFSTGRPEEKAGFFVLARRGALSWHEGADDVKTTIPVCQQTTHPLS